MSEPTAKQIEYANYLANRMGISLPEDHTKDAYSKFIDYWKPVVKHEDDAMNEPSGWALSYL